jgi:hypothetical protein
LARRAHKVKRLINIPNVPSELAIDMYLSPNNNKTMDSGITKYRRVINPDIAIVMRIPNIRIRL